MRVIPVAGVARLQVLEIDPWKAKDLNSCEPSYVARHSRSWSRKTSSFGDRSMKGKGSELLRAQLRQLSGIGLALTNAPLQLASSARSFVIVI